MTTIIKSHKTSWKHGNINLSVFKHIHTRGIRPFVLSTSTKPMANMKIQHKQNSKHTNSTWTKSHAHSRKRHSNQSQPSKITIKQNFGPKCLASKQSKDVNFFFASQNIWNKVTLDRIQVRKIWSSNTKIGLESKHSNEW